MNQKKHTHLGVMGEVDIQKTKRLIKQASQLVLGDRWEACPYMEFKPADLVLITIIFFARNKLMGEADIGFSIRELFTYDMLNDDEVYVLDEFKGVFKEISEIINKVDPEQHIKDKANG